MEVLDNSCSKVREVPDAHRKENKGKWWRRAKGESSNGSDRKEKSNEKAAKPGEPTIPLIQLYSFADKLDYVLMFFGSIGAAGHGLGLPLINFFFGSLVNGIGTSTQTQQTINKFALYYLWTSILCFGSSWLEIAFWMHTGHRQSGKLRAKYVQALLRQDVGYFDTETSIGDVVNSLATDTLAVQDAICEKTGHFLHYMTTFFASFILAFSSQWRIAVVTLAILPCIAVTGGTCAYYLTSYTTKTSASYSEAGSVAQQETLKLGVRSALVKGIGLGLTALVVFCSDAVLFTYSGFLVRKGEVNGGRVIATIFNVIMGSTALAQAMANLTPFSRARASASKMFQVIGHEPVINKPDDSAETPKRIDGHIEFRSVSFSYPSRPDVSIFQNFSLTILPGTSVAVVGSSGSGKSTIVSLLERFYDPTAGRIFLDGVNLKKLDLTWLRRQIGLVNQEPALFATTIVANIAYGSDTASQNDIEEAAKVANAHSFISQLPNGYQTQVGERGVQLSGGQRQRIAIARAIVKHPRVLLLDEATSALDAGSERVVQQALDRIMVGRTTVIVAHRLSTIRNADTIVVVDQGRLVERGTHQELISKVDGAFSALVHVQKLATTNDITSDDVSLEEINLVTSLNCEREQSKSGYPRGGFTSSYQEQQERGSWGSIRHLISMTKEDWKYGVLAVIGSVGSGCTGPLLALIIANVLSVYYNVDYTFMKKQIARFSWMFFGLGAFTFLSTTIQHFALGMMGEKLVTGVRVKLFANILRNEVGWFDKVENNSNQLAARLASDAATVRLVIGDRVSVLLQIVAMLLVSFAISYALLWKLALVTTALFPLIVCSNAFEQWIFSSFAKNQTKAYERATQVAGEAVGNIRTVAAFSAENNVQALFTNELDGPSKQSFWKGHMAGFGYGLSQFFLYGSMALGLWTAGHLVASRDATFSTSIKVYLVMVITAYMAADVFSLVPDLIKGGQAAASLFKLMDRVSKIEPDNPQGLKPEKIRGDIELKEVTLTYPSRPDVIVLRSMDLKVMAGQSLALVGASGSGKSSIIALIERFYDPIAGVILIDGKDVKNYNLQFLRQNMALVQQEPALFATTVHENIVYGKDQASEAEVIEAAKAANAHNFISSLPDGYNTPVGEGGVQLSGGQKQRVAIARAVLKDPKIFLLDEATSALDAESEKVVQEAIDRLMMGRTTVIVAHRLSTVRRADSIAVVQDGIVVEQGSHTPLHSRGGAYSRLIRLQQQQK